SWVISRKTVAVEIGDVLDVTPTLADDQQSATARVVAGAPPWMTAHPGATMMPPSTVSVFHPTPTPSLGKREREDEDETDTQRRKREKAAERQRRKRQRDREGRDDEGQPGVNAHTQELDEEEQARRERVRAAARERQRRHRMAVKQRKLQEMGLEMDPAAEQQYETYPPPPPHQPRQVVPPNSVLGGQTFATTLLLSFSCVPLLKQHLLRTLHMTNEELASLEPIIAQAFDHWDRQRRMAFQAIHGVPMPPPSAFAPPLGTITAPEILPPPPHPPYGSDPNNPSGSGEGSPDNREALREQLQRVFQGSTPYSIPAPPPPPPPQENVPPPQPSHIDPNLAESKPAEVS
ncbi:hypothetical protein K525DRAFT_195962, partial [Schizophyllum commune Loenen D]